MKICFGYYKHSLINQAEVDKNTNHKQSQNSHEHVKTITFWVHEYVIYELLSHSLKNKRIQLHGMQIQVNIYFIWVRSIVLYFTKIVYFVLLNIMLFLLMYCKICYGKPRMVMQLQTRNDRQLLMVLSVLQNKWLATNSSKRTPNWASNIDILQYNEVLPVFFVRRKVAFQQLGSI